MIISWLISPHRSISKVDKSKEVKEIIIDSFALFGSSDKDENIFQVGNVSIDIGREPNENVFNPVTLEAAGEINTETEFHGELLIALLHVNNKVIEQTSESILTMCDEESNPIFIENEDEVRLLIKKFGLNHLIEKAENLDILSKFVDFSDLETDRDSLFF